MPDITRENVREWAERIRARERETHNYDNGPFLWQAQLASVVIEMAEQLEAVGPVVEAARKVSAAWESDDLLPANTSEIMFLMNELAVALKVRNA